MSFYSQKSRTLSFELFPPKSAAGEESLYNNVGELMEFRPEIVTCTYGAGGSTQSKTLEILREVKKRCGVRVASHLTCVGLTVDQLREYLQQAIDQGIEGIVALRGDPPKGSDTFTMTTGGLRWASDLVHLIRSEFPNLGIAVAGYPETHQEAISPQSDLENLKRKVDLGGDCVITQLFYDNQDFFRFRDRCDAAGISVPLIPGILPVTNLGQIQRIASLCKARLPESFLTKLSEKDDPEWQFDVGVEFATAQVEELLANGAPGIHFYVLNKSLATLRVLRQVWPSDVSAT